MVQGHGESEILTAFEQTLAVRTLSSQVKALADRFFFETVVRWRCARVVQLFLSSGSHFLAQADWGCEDGNHSAWMIVDVDSKDDARTIVPPPLRSEARIVGLNKFTIDQIDNILKGHRL